MSKVEADPAVLPGLLVTAGPAARAGFTWRVSGKLTRSAAAGTSAEVARLLRTDSQAAGHSHRCRRRGSSSGLLLRGAGREGSCSCSGAEAPPAHTSGGAGPCPASAAGGRARGPPPEEGRGWRCCPRVPSPRAHRRVRRGGCCACVRADRGAVCLQDGAGAAHPAAALLLSCHREKRGLGARRLLCAGT